MTKFVGWLQCFRFLKPMFTQLESNLSVCNTKAGQLFITSLLECRPYLHRCINLKTRKAMKANHVTIGLTNPKSPTNVGAVMRAAGCFQVNEVKYTGLRYEKSAKFHTDTKSVTRKIPLTAVDSFLDDLDPETEIICVELAEGATPLPHFQHPKKAMYIFGPEDGSISQEVADKAHHVVYIPTIGCMNLAATVNVLLYDRLAKSGSMDESEDLIRSSRDNRNHLKVKTTAL